MNMPTTPPDALVRALELEGGSPTRSPRARSPDAASVPSSPASAFSARSESARRALSPHASISKMAQSADDWDRDDEWRSPARASPSTTGRRRADGLEALSSSEDGDDDFDDDRSTGRESAFHTPAAHLLNATSTTTSSRCNTGKSSALGRDADEWMREARERIADLEISSSPIDPSNDDRSVSISPGGLPATPTRTSPAPRVDAATKVSREVDAMILKAAARAEAAAAAAANRSARLAMTGPLRSPAAVERAGRDADAAREATARRLEVEAAAAEAEAARMLAEAARKREEAAAAEALAESAEASMAESAQLCVDDGSPRATYSPYSTRGHDASCSSFDSALDVTTVSAGTIETAIENKETVSLLRAVGAPGEGSMGAPAPSSSTRTSAPTGPYPTSWEDALNDILASVPSPLVSPIEKAVASPSPIEDVAHEYQYLEVKKVETRTTEEEAVTPTTGQMLEISARERAVQTELDMLDDRYRTVVASRRRELLEATLAERDAVAEELARRQVVEAASAPNPATHVASSPRPSPRSPARSPARPSPRSSPAKNAAEECPEQCPTRSTDPCADERPPWTDRLAAPSPTSAATPTSAARRTFLRRGTGNGGAPVTGNATPSPAAKQRTSRTPATREDTLRHEFIASVERERERHRARSASRTPGSAGVSSRRRTLSSKSPNRVRAPSRPTPDYSAVEPRYMSEAEAKSSAPWRGSPYTPSWRPNGYNNNRVDDHGSSPAEDAGARSVDTRTRTPPRRSVTPEPRRRAPPRATPVKQVDKKKDPGAVRNATPGARKVNPNPKPSTPMRFGSTPEGKDGSTPSAAYVEAAENMRRSLKRLSAASEAADLILMRSTAAVVAADEEKKCADRGGLEATFIDAFRGAEKGDARRSPKAKASPEPANDFERQFLAAYRKYAATPSPVPAPKEEIVPSAWIPSMPPTPEANKPAPASPRVKSAPPSKKSPLTAAKVTRESTKPKPKPATSMEAARASLARLNAATNAKDGEYTPPSPQQQPNVVEEPKAESPAVKLFSEKMSAPSPVKHRKPEPVVETTKAPVNLVAADSDSDDDPLLGLDENADIRRFLGTPGRRREESAKSPLTSLGVNHNSPRPGSSKATAEMQKQATVPVATSVPVAPALAPALDKDKRKREDREVEDFEALLSLDPSQPRPARKLSGGADANTAASTQRKPVHAKKPSAPLPVPTAAVPRIRGRSSLLTRPAVEPKLPASAATFQQKTRGLNAGSVLSRSRREYEDEKVARLKAEAEECTFSPRTIGTPAYLKKKRAGGGSGKKKEVRYAELPMRGSSAWR